MLGSVLRQDILSYVSLVVTQVCHSKYLFKSAGKIVGQCCHGTMKAYHNLQKTQPALLQAWLDSGEPKVVLGATHLDHMNQLMQVCMYSTICCIKCKLFLKFLGSYFFLYYLHLLPVQ